MKDFCMCRNEECNKKDSCKRYDSEINNDKNDELNLQTYGLFEVDKNGECEYYLCKE